MKKKWISLSLLSILILSGCSTDIGLNQSDTGGTTSTTDKTATTSQLSTSYYRTVLPYQVSASRGYVANGINQLNSLVNVKELETGLMRLSQNVFPTDQYLFGEGQHLTVDIIGNWLKRQSEENPEGLNPADNGSVEPTERAPYYLNNILEQNYYVQDGDINKLSGASIGLAMNSVDYYKKEEGGPTFTTEISREVLEQQGKEMANKIIAKMRTMEGLESVPIVIALFEQSTTDSPSPGNYFAYAVSENGATEVTNWVPVNEKNYIFPSAEAETDHSGDMNNFSNFKSEVESFFPNLNGVVGDVQYIDDAMTKMKITINVQFYGQAEIIGFTQQVTDSVDRFLPKNVDVEVSIQSIDGMEAFISRDANVESITQHIFD